MIDPENSPTTGHLAAEALRHIKPETLQAIQMHEDGTSWSAIAEEIGAPNGRAAEQRARRARHWMEKRFGKQWGRKHLKP